MPKGESEAECEARLAMGAYAVEEIATFRAWQERASTLETREGQPIGSQYRAVLRNREFSRKLVEKRATDRRLTAVRRLEGMLDKIPAERRASTRENHQWVGTHLRTSPEELERIGLDKIPSRVALNMLIEVVGRADDREGFWNRFRQSTTGESSDAERERRFEDDGRDIAEFCDKFLRIHAEEAERLRAKGTGGKRPLSEAGYSGGGV